jgi:glyoxylase I family protein
MGDIQVGTAASKPNSIPERLHHTAYVCRDLEATCKFYQDVLGWPLVAAWREHDFVFGADAVYCHIFFQIGDGSLLAFFRFSDADMQQRFAQYGPHSPFVHLAFKATDAAAQDEIRRRLEAAGHETSTLNHGYCKSLYVTDPNGLNLEFAVDHPDWSAICAKRKASAHDDLARWLKGDRTTNNEWRDEAHANNVK